MNEQLIGALHFVETAPDKCGSLRDRCGRCAFRPDLESDYWASGTHGCLLDAATGDLPEKLGCSPVTRIDGRTGYFKLRFAPEPEPVVDKAQTKIVFEEGQP